MQRNPSPAENQSPNVIPHSRQRFLIAVGLGTLAAALLFVPLPNDYRALWYGEAMDAAHVVLFALLTVGLSKLAWPGAWLLPGALAASLAAGAEVVQPLVGRSRSLRDLAYGLLGIAIALVMLSSARRTLKVAAVAALAAWPIASAGPALFDAWWAWRSFPMLAHFDSPVEERRWMLQGVRIVAPRPGSAIFEFEPSHNGSGAILLPVVRDWTAYQTLEVDFAFEGEPMTFLISVRDGKKLPPELPRFDLWRRYEPGTHHVRIDLAELRRGGSFPPIDLSRVQSLHLVAYSDRVQIVKVSRIELTGRTTDRP